MRAVTLLDTATASTNLGDQIIMDAVRRETAPLLQDAFVYSVASHEYMGKKSRSLLARSDCVIAGGTNLLTSRMWYKPLWKLSWPDAFRNFGVTLMGAGWYQFQRKPDLYTSFLLKRVLDGQGMHSVRDGYTRDMLARVGISNVVNTGCPTLWNLTPGHCRDIPAVKARHVVTTLNTYIPAPELDRRLLEILGSCYEKIYFWTQTESDYEYTKGFGLELVYLDPSLSALDRLLESETSLDYVGNRLHAGIRALQKKRRSIIVEIDNRAKEMGADFGLPTVTRDGFETLAGMINGEVESSIQLPVEEIAQWKEMISARCGQTPDVGGPRVTA